MKFYTFFVLIFLLSTGLAFAGEANVLAVKITDEGSNRSYRFAVTVSHDDAGWEHYADGWDVVAPDGTVIATRTLLHPHVDEQPFTRSLSGVKIQTEIDQIVVRAHDSVHGYGGKTVTKQVQ